MILATAGHIDHGKTALIRALTGIDADRLPEEKRRGMTIDLGFAHTRSRDGFELSFVDVPGHQRFLPNMLAGILSIDRVLLVVAADDGPRPQTIEHLDVLELIGVAEITAVVTKIDRVGPDRVAAVMAEVAELLAKTGHPDATKFAVSSRTGDGVGALVQYLQQRARRAKCDRGRTAPPGLFRMAIDRAFGLPGIGLIVTGTVSAGSVAVGDRLVASPRGNVVRVRGLHAQSHPIEIAQAGERCAINIAGSFSEGGEPCRGDWLVAPERHLSVGRIDLFLRVSRHAGAALRDGLPVHLHLGTEDVVGRVSVLSGRAIGPGGAGFVQIDLDRAIGALHGDRAVLRDHAARSTLAGGQVVDPLARRRGRREGARLAWLEAMRLGDPATALRRLLTITGFVDIAQFALARNLTRAETEAATECLDKGSLLVGPQRAPIAITAQCLAELADTIAALLVAQHEAQPEMLGPTTPVLMAQLDPMVPKAALEAALSQLIEAGRAVREAGMWHLAGHRPRLSDADERLWQRTSSVIAETGLRPPRVREIADSLALNPDAVASLLDRAERLGRVAKVSGNRFFLPETLERLAEIARNLAGQSADGSFTASMFKDHSGIGRNLTISILEFFDKMGATRRVGDARVIQHGAEMSF